MRISGIVVNYFTNRLQILYQILSNKNQSAILQKIDLRTVYKTHDIITASKRNNKLITNTKCSFNRYKTSSQICVSIS